MSARKKTKTIAIAAACVLLAALAIWTAWGNTALELSTYQIASDDLPPAFDGYRIAHISDLHNAQMGRDNEALLAMLREAKPDMIAMTGDMIDSRHTDVEIALRFAREAAGIAPCYYVTGNHESRTPAYAALREGFTQAGVVVLEDDRTEISRAGESIVLLGVNDPSFQSASLFGDSRAAMEGRLRALMSEEGAYTVLLSHRPELFDVYVNSGVNLALSGHAHGGQFRLPFVGGLIAPHQGLFPAYDAGLYAKENTSMIVSRGIGNSLFPFRFNNRPEVVLIELASKANTDDR